MENKKNIAVSVSLLLIGAVVGYSFAVAGDSRNASMHQMSDGTMMSNNSHTMEGMMMDMNAGLRGKTGDELDQAFLKEMIVHHQGAIEMADMLLASGKHPELKLLAQNIIEAQTKEITMMKQWLKAWYNM